MSRPRKTYEPQKQVLILGLGHIGASLSARLSRQGWGVWGWDKSAVAVKTCFKRGWIYHVAAPQSLPDYHASICVVALPETAVDDRAFLRLLSRLPRGMIVTDVFSSKGKATRKLAMHCRARGLKHVWSHPLAGREGSGVASADHTIFEGALTLLDRQGDRVAVRSLSRFWKSVGCSVEIMSTREHQRGMSLGSHLMHVAAFALTKTVARGGRVSPSVLSATRVAKSDPEAWADILLSNSKDINRAVREFEREMKRIIALARAGRRDALRASLAHARKLRLKMEER